MLSKLSLIFLTLVVLTSCTRRHKADNLHYFQDFESIAGWFGVPALSSDIKGHSGNYTVLTNAQMDYSPGLSRQLKEISARPLKKIKASVWCYTMDKNCSGAFCVQIMNAKGENKLWIARAFVDFIKSESTWTKTVIETEIPNEAINPENTVKVFIWNKGTIPVYGDDVEVVFME